MAYHHEGRDKKGRSTLDRFLARIPLCLSYVILLSTWMLFMLFITLGQVLIKRHAVWHFIEQVIIYNALLGLTLLSLITASGRAPGSPDQSLAPPLASPSHVDDIGFRQSHSPRFTGRADAAHVPATAQDDDDVPLRFLRNSRWVTTRISKDRPSPLPLPNTQRQSMLNSTPTKSSASSHSSDLEFSPFPLSAVPFLPNTAKEAGEDDLDISQTKADTQLRERENAALLEQDEQHRSRSLMAKSNTGEARWCRKCDAWKPDRSHHCRSCQQCVLKMDHHCPWVANCIGYHNYKSFLLFLTYGSLLAVYVTFEAGYEVIRFFQDPDDAVMPPQTQTSVVDGVNITSTCMPGHSCTASANSIIFPDQLGLSPAVAMMLAIFGGFMTIAVGGLACFHWYLASTNQTTLENLNHSYPTALLDALPPANDAATSRSSMPQPRWKPDHLLTRQERTRLRNEAREINVYDLGGKRNLRNLLIGDTESGRFVSIFKAMWPMSRRADRLDKRSGHFFPYDPLALERLKELTMELRYGVTPVTPTTASTSASASDVGSTSDSDVRGSDAEDYDADEEKGTDSGGRREGVKWFEA